MPLLISWVASAIGFLVEFFSAYLARKFAATLAMTVIITAAWATCFAAIKAIIAGLHLVMPPALANAFTYVHPTGLEASIAAYFAGRVAIAGYRWARDTVRATEAIASAPTSTYVPPTYPGGGYSGHGL